MRTLTTRNSCAFDREIRSENCQFGYLQEFEITLNPKPYTPNPVDPWQANLQNLNPEALTQNRSPQPIRVEGLGSRVYGLGFREHLKPKPGWNSFDRSLTGQEGISEDAPGFEEASKEAMWVKG